MVDEPPTCAAASAHQASADSAGTAAGGGASPSQRALDAAWYGPVRRRAMRLRNLWRNVRLAWRYRMHRLRPADVEVEVPAGQVPDCERCRDSCCRGVNLVSLRLSDLARWHDAGLGWAIEAADPEARRAIYAENPALEQIESRDAFALFPVVKHTAQGDCVFLDAAGRCSVYPLRPLVCRRFPYRVSDDLVRIGWVQGCAFPRQDGTTAETDALVAAAIESYNEKLRDLVMLHYGWQELEAIGLAQYLKAPGAGRAPLSSRTSGSGR